MTRRAFRPDRPNYPAIIIVAIANIALCFFVAAIIVAVRTPPT